MAILFSASDAHTVPRERPPIATAPLEFDGSLEKLHSEHLGPVALDATVVRDFHEALKRILAFPRPLFLLRSVRGTERRERSLAADGFSFVATDNAPAWWTYGALAAGHRIAPSSTREVFETIPCHMFDVAKRSAPTPAGSGWHIAHIFDVKDRDTDFARWGREELTRRFIRNIHPVNYFILPKTDWQRWGGDARVVAYMAARHAERYGEVWREFLHLAGVDDRGLERANGDVRITISGDSAAPIVRVARDKGAVGRASVPRPAPPSRPTQHLGELALKYRATRLHFKRDLIEPLALDERFAVETPGGTFSLTKREFYDVFPNVVESRSYRENGGYHFPQPPKKALQFLTRMP